MIDWMGRTLSKVTDPIAKRIRKAWVTFVDMVTRGINKLLK